MRSFRQRACLVAMVLVVAVLAWPTALVAEGGTNNPDAAIPPLFWTIVRFGPVALQAGTAAFQLSGLGSTFPDQNAQLAVWGDEDELHLKLNGGAVGWTSSDYKLNGEFKSTVEGKVFPLLEATFWTWDLDIHKESENVNDKVIVKGFVQHRVALHTGEDVKGPQLDFEILLDADNATKDANNNYVVTGTKSDNEWHGAHPDTLQANATATVTSTLWFDDILSYNLRLDAHHVPEPSSLLALGAGMTGLLGLARRKRAA